MKKILYVLSNLLIIVTFITLANAETVVTYESPNVLKKTLTKTLITPIEKQILSRSPELETIVKVAAIKKIKPEHLVAIALQESSFGKYLVGDGGCSKGFYHRNTCVWGNEGIGNLEQETIWVADKLNSYGYQDDLITMSFSRYNAPNRPNMQYAEKVKSRIPSAINMLQ